MCKSRIKNGKVATYKCCFVLFFFYVSHERKEKRGQRKTGRWKKQLHRTREADCYRKSIRDQPKEQMYWCRLSQWIVVLFISGKNLEKVIAVPRVTRDRSLMQFIERRHRCINRTVRSLDASSVRSFGVSRNQEDDGINTIIVSALSTVDGYLASGYSNGKANKKRKENEKKGKEHGSNMLIHQGVLIRTNTPNYL